MSDQAIEGTVVRRGGGVSRRDATVSGGSNPPRTEYVYVQDKQSRGGRLRGASVRYTGQPLRTVPVPHGLPRWLGSQKIVGYAWLMSMILVGFDEWHNNNILPRPMRLWYTSAVYGILAILGLSEAMVPLVNALALGYTLVLFWQYYQGKGQFS